jgi:hypothetical protein
MNEHQKVIDRLKLYGLYFLQYTQTKPRTEKRTARALFLGETKKQIDSGLTELLNRADGTEVSVTDRYLDIAFLAYRPGSGIPDSAPSNRYDVFTVYFCNPDGLEGLSADHVIILPPDYRTKQFVDRPNVPHVELLKKLRHMAEDTGLIDINLAKISKKATERLTTTKIRELHHGFTRMIEKAKPDSNV